MHEAKILNGTSLYPDLNSLPALELPEGVTVSVLEEDKEWTKIHYKTVVGYVSTKDLATDKISNVMISIPRECANSLYEALKFALKK